MSNIKVYRLYKKSEFEYHIKSGRKIVEKIRSAMGNWVVCGVMCPDLESAIAYFIESHEEFMNMFGGNVRIGVDNQGLI